MAIRRKCSFADFSKCNQGKYTKKRGTKAVKDEDRALLAKRADISVDAAKNICYHHEQELLVCYSITKRQKQSFSERTKKCANPFNIRHKLNVKDLRPVTEKYMSGHPTLEDLVQIGDKLCTKCRKKVHDADSQYNLQVESGHSSGPSTSGTTAPDTGSSASEESTAMPCKTPTKESRDVAKEKTDTLMSAIEDTPLRTSE